jgi:hypothetical protein
MPTDFQVNTAVAGLTATHSADRITGGIGYSMSKAGGAGHCICGSSNIPTFAFFCFPQRSARCSHCRKDWRAVSIEDLDFDTAELARLLIPALHVRETKEQVSPAEYGVFLVRGCREGLSAVLLFTNPEGTFLDLLLNRGEIDPTLSTADPSLQRRIRSQPPPHLVEGGLHPGQHCATHCVE